MITVEEVSDLLYRYWSLTDEYDLYKLKTVEDQLFKLFPHLIGDFLKFKRPNKLYDNMNEYFSKKCELMKLCGYPWCSRDEFDIERDKLHDVIPDLFVISNSCNLIFFQDNETMMLARLII